MRAKKQTAHSSASKALRGRRVLVAEDSWHLAFAVKTLLEGEGAIVVGPASTLREAEQLANTVTLDAAVIDVNLQGSMADTFIKRLASQGLTVVVVTGFERPNGLNGAAIPVLRKPVDPSALIEALAVDPKAGKAAS